jgi:hypothetical protein
MNYNQGDFYCRKFPIVTHELEWKSFDITEITGNSVKIQGHLANNLKVERKILLTDFEQFLTDFNQATNDNR